MLKSPFPTWLELARVYVYYLDLCIFLALHRDIYIVLYCYKQFTDDYCLSACVVPPPISPTAKSAGTPSDAGSQDSDGAVGPRYTHCLTICTCTVLDKCINSADVPISGGGKAKTVSTWGIIIKCLVLCWFYLAFYFSILFNCYAYICNICFQCLCHSLNCRTVLQQISCEAFWKQHKEACLFCFLMLGITFKLYKQSLWIPVKHNCINSSWVKTFYKVLHHYSERWRIPANWVHVYFICVPSN